MPTNPNRPGRTAGAVVAGLALGASLAWLGTVSDAVSAALGGVLAGVVLVDQARRSQPSPTAASDGNDARRRSPGRPL